MFPITKLNLTLPDQTKYSLIKLCALIKSPIPTKCLHGAPGHGPAGAKHYLLSFSKVTKFSQTFWPNKLS